MKRKIATTKSFAPDAPRREDLVFSGLTGADARKALQTAITLLRDMSSRGSEVTFAQLAVALEVHAGLTESAASRLLAAALGLPSTRSGGGATARRLDLTAAEARLRLCIKELSVVS